ncbi:WD40/YVTN/BNR-like repeat-containing protein [Marinifilum caeruleilacunae]|uniref:Photosynthesis system II assembly factor Ycf48/Hcf136-like domain-containing protein n=1 Tax=Marinifilum caeruleilacunae TaxID=2499076 RepID=A0ABX1WV69_9BACT|nr:YCF48-related protein [Marinifilum caeruleilacunae]NOU59957.1 hypothetical protein [Marinifilum caeruleilacunae]
MKKALMLLLGAPLFFSCQNDEIEPAPEEHLHDENCQYKTEMTAPQGFTIEEKSSIEMNGSLKEIQFLNEDVAYILGSNNYGGHADVFKSEDGGKTWSDLNLQLRRSPENMFFLNKEIGFVSTNDKGKLLKTIDGGLNWTEIHYENINGMLHRIQKDHENNLYAISRISDAHSVLIKSTDEGNTWNIINESYDFGATYSTFSFKILEDKIYVSGKHGKLIVTDLDGDLLKVIETDLSDFLDVEIIDHDHIIVSHGNKTYQSADGGLNWTSLEANYKRLLDFTNKDTGLVLLNKASCPVADYPLDQDVIAFTTDGGHSWEESQEFTNLIVNYVDCFKMNDSRYFLLVEQKLYELQKEKGID